MAHRWRPKWCLIGVAFCLIVAAAIAYYYPDWKLNRLRAHADAHFQGSRWALAAQGYKKILEQSPADERSLERMVAISQRLPHMNEAEWREQLMASTPENLENRLAWAGYLLRVDRLHQARKVLEGAPESAWQRPDFHLLQARISFAARRYQAAEDSIRQALELDNQPESQLLLLEVLLQQRQQEDHQDVISLSNQLLTLPEWKNPATRALRDSSIAHREYDAALDLSHDLVLSGKTTHDDLLIHTGLLLTMKPDQTHGFLVSLRPRLQTDPVLLHRISTLIIERGQPGLARQWLDFLRPDYGESFYHRLAEIDLLLHFEEWESTERLLGAADSWGANEPMRQALLARLAHGQNNDAQASLHWKKAIRLSAEHPVGSLMLAEVAKNWPQWEGFSAELLNTMFDQGLHLEYAYARLRDLYRGTEQPEQLLRLISRMMELNPGNPNLENDFVMYALLTNSQVEDAYARSKALYAEYPDSVLIATTEAFSQYHQGHYEQALAILDQLDPRAVLVPEIAFYRALFLKATGSEEEARKFRQYAENASLIKLERELWEKNIETEPHE